MRCPAIIWVILVGIFAAIAVALPPYHNSDTLDVTINTNNEPASSPMLALNLDFTGIDVDNSSFPSALAARDTAASSVISCNPDGFDKASKSGIKTGIKHLKLYNGSTSCHTGKCKWASCTAPGAAIWWCNYAGHDVITTYRVIAKFAQEIMDSCQASKDDFGDSVVSGIWDEQNQWRVLVMKDKHLC
ncbi:hypothetical protein BJX63DRAFT_426721 [Aspergillus granulosus]|uniref:Uncharacterized protein n=1 Tax=Aspergillus granulosus TaxID=176169 RepID=A0ABR4I6J5_9EURO